MNTIPELQPEDIERFWVKTNKNSGRTPSIENPVNYGHVIGDCWEWNGKPNVKGYGRFFVKGSVYGAHRVSARIHGKLNKDAEGLVLHECDNPKCVNPAHLSVGTPAENTRQMISRNRQSRGHGLKGETNPMTKAKKETVIKVFLEYHQSDISTAELAEKYGFSKGWVEAVIRYRVWGHETRKLNVKERTAFALSRNNRSGATGVSFRRNGRHVRRWVAYIGVDKKQFRIGSFHSKSEAVAARKECEVILQQIQELASVEI